MNSGKTIGNVATLDLRTASEASIAGIQRIGNVATLLCSPQTADLITKIVIDNVAEIVEVPDDATVHVGQIEITGESLKDLEKPLTMVVVGQVLVNSDVTGEAIKNGLAKLYVIGQVLSPENLSGDVQAKLGHGTGQVLTYQEGATIITGQLILDENFLLGLEDGSSFFIIGRLNAFEVIPNELLVKKIKSLQVLGKVTCREENAEALQSLLSGKFRSPNIEIIPSGFTYVKDALVIDPGMVENLPSSMLYCQKSVQIMGDVTPELLDAQLKALVVKGTLICPTALRTVVSKKINVLETKSLFYQGELWLIDNPSTLTSARFDYLDGKATLIVHEVLEIEDTLEPKMLADRLDKVHNLCMITATTEQIAALQSRLGTDEGEFIDISKKKEEPGQEEWIGNAAYLKL